MFSSSPRMLLGIVLCASMAVTSVLAQSVPNRSAPKYAYTTTVPLTVIVSSIDKQTPTSSTDSSGVVTWSVANPVLTTTQPVYIEVTCNQAPVNTPELHVLEYVPAAVAPMPMFDRVAKAWKPNREFHTRTSHVKPQKRADLAAGGVIYVFQINPSNDPTQPQFNLVKGGKYATWAIADNVTSPYNVEFYTEP